MHLLPLSLIFLCLVTHSATLFAGTDTKTTNYKVQNQFVVGGSGGWDYLNIDTASRRLFISRSDRVQVLNLADGSVIGTIAGTEGVHGITFAPELGKGFTSNGRSDSVTVFDLATLKVTGTLPVSGHNPDAILYDPSSKHLFTFNGRSNDVSVIDPASAKVLATIPVNGKPEFAATDESGHVFVNIEDKSQLLMIDSKQSKVSATWPLAGCEEPSGLALDNFHHRLFSVCQNGIMVVTDATSGKHVASIPIGKGPDAAAFDAKRGLVFSSNGQDGTLTVIYQDNADRYSVLTNVATQKSARTMAIDSESHRVYLVAAEFGTAPAASKEQPHPRPPIVDGSFRVIVVGN